MPHLKSKKKSYEELISKADCIEQPNRELAVQI
jgi:hypothetical protein